MLPIDLRELAVIIQFSQKVFTSRLRRDIPSFTSSPTSTNLSPMAGIRCFLTSDLTLAGPDRTMSNFEASAAGGRPNTGEAM